MTGVQTCALPISTGALRMVEREAEEFDEEAVEEYLSDKEKGRREGDFISATCPSARLETFQKTSAEEPPETLERKQQESQLSHWPVQIMLVPPKAPFLKGADLLVVADCVPVSYSRFHQDFLKGRKVMMGCPKFDDAELYIQKFEEICKQSGIKSITSVIMEVPCCSALPMIVRKGLERSGKRIPMEQVTISTRGEILERKKVA